MSQENGDAREEELRKRIAQMQKKQQYGAQLGSILRKLLEQGSYERMMNVKISNEELFFKAGGAIIQAAQSGRIKEKVTEEQLKIMLGTLSHRHEPKIEIRKK